MALFVETLLMNRTISFPQNQRVSLAWARDDEGKGVAFVCAERQLSRLEGDILHPIHEFSRRVHRLNASPDGRFLGAACGASGSIVDLDGNVTATLDAAVCMASIDAVVPLDAVRALVHLSSNALGFLSPEGFRAFEQKSRGSSAKEALSPDGAWGVAVGAEAMTRLFDVASGKQIKTFNEGCDGSCGVAFSHDRTLMLHGRRKGGNALVVRSVGKKWNEIQTIPLPTFAGASVRVGPHFLGFSPDSTRVWAVEHDIGTAARVSVWQRDSGVMLHETILVGGPTRIWPWAAVGDGHTLLLALNSTAETVLQRVVIP
jgi:hypothetical protein